MKPNKKQPLLQRPLRPPKLKVGGEVTGLNLLLTAQETEGGHASHETYMTAHSNLWVWVARRPDEGIGSLGQPGVK